MSNGENISRNKLGQSNNNKGVVSSRNQKVVYQDKEVEDFLGGSYLSIKDGESYNLQFFPDENSKMAKIVQVKNKWSGQNDTKVQFIVGIIEEETDIKYKLNLKKRHAMPIYALIQKGHEAINVSRTGSNMNDTKYTAEPLDGN